MEKGEDPQLSLSVSFNISHIFPGEFKIAEVSLGGNQWIEDMSRLHFKQEGTVMRTYNNTIKESTRDRWVSSSDFVITLNPMEIRTFVMSPLVNDGTIGRGIKSQTIVGSFIFIITTTILRNSLIS